jgi:hypothetical protein
LYNQTILCGSGAILIRQFCSSVLTKYVFPHPVGPVMFAVNGCRKRNPFSTSLVAAVAAVMAEMDIHDYLYVCIDDGGDGGGGYT